MVDVRNKGCSYVTCTREPYFKAEGNGAKYCRRHAPGDIVNGRNNRRLDGFCTSTPSLDVDGSKTGVCGQHPEDGTVEARKKTRLGKSRTSDAPFYTEDKTAECGSRAADGIANVRNKPGPEKARSNEKPVLYLVDVKPTMSLEHNAEESTTGIYNKRCSHEFCTREASWGTLADGAGTACADHNMRISEGAMVNFLAPCNVLGCEEVSTWGPRGEQPSHCHDHGPLKNGLVLTVRPNRVRNNSSKSSYRALGTPSFHVKTECKF